MKSSFKFSSGDALLALTSVYCVVAVLMNLLCMKALSFGTPFILMDGGLLISWIVFLTSNVTTEVYGRPTAIRVSSIATVVCFCASVVSAVEVLIPTLPEYKEQAEAFARIFSNGPRTIISSAIAFWTGNFINVTIIDSMKRHAAGRDNGFKFMGRAVLSTIVGQAADNMIFQSLAFMPVGISPYEMAWKDILTAVVASTIVETVVEGCFVPVITIPLTRSLQKKKAAEEQEAALRAKTGVSARA